MGTLIPDRGIPTPLNSVLPHDLRPTMFLLPLPWRRQSPDGEFLLPPSTGTVLPHDFPLTLFYMCKLLFPPWGEVSFTKPELGEVTVSPHSQKDLKPSQYTLNNYPYYLSCSGGMVGQQRYNLITMKSD